MYMKITRTYHFTKEVHERTARLNRSATVDKALADVIERPEILVKALEHRLNRGVVTHNDPVKAAITIDHSKLEQVGDLADQCGLPIEHVMRLALEAYLSKY